MASHWISLPMASRPRWLPLPKVQARILTQIASHGFALDFASHGFLTEMAPTSKITSAPCCFPLQPGHGLGRDLRPWPWPMVMAMAMVMITIMIVDDLLEKACFF